MEEVEVPVRGEGGSEAPGGDEAVRWRGAGAGVLHYFELVVSQVVLTHLYSIGVCIKRQKPFARWSYGVCRKELARLLALT